MLSCLNVPTQVPRRPRTLLALPLGSGWGGSGVEAEKVMRNLILSALFLASAFQTAHGDQAGDWYFTVSYNQATINAYTGSSINVVIPSQVNGIPVTKLGAGGVGSILRFNSNTVQAVTIPDTVTDIASGAFESCVALKSVTIPGSVLSIGDHAFGGCTGLTSATINNGVLTIGKYAFQRCQSLANVSIGSTVSQIGEYALAYCPQLQGVYFMGNKPQTTTKDNTIFNTSTPILYYLAGTTGWDGVYANRPLRLYDNGIDSDGDGLTDIQESVSYGTNPILPDSNGDGVTDGHAVLMGFSPTTDLRVLISHPPTGLYTASQMQAMAIGDLVLTKNANGSFTLNYDIEQSADLQTWTTYEALSLPLEGLPTDKAFVRIKAKQ